MIIKIITSKYLFFIFLSFVLNIILAIHVAKTSYNEKNRLQVREIIQCGIIETVDIILGAKIIDIIMNYDVLFIVANNTVYATELADFSKAVVTVTYSDDTHLDLSLL